MDKRFNLEGRRALVTGGGRGIGRSIGLASASHGADVAVAARSRDQLEAVAEEIRIVSGYGIGCPSSNLNGRS